MSRRSNNVRGPTSALTEFLRVRSLSRLSVHRSLKTTPRNLASIQLPLHAVSQQGSNHKDKTLLRARARSKAEMLIKATSQTRVRRRPLRQRPRRAVADDVKRLLYVRLISFSFDLVTRPLELGLCVRSTRRSRGRNAREEAQSPQRKGFCGGQIQGQKEGQRGWRL